MTQPMHTLGVPIGFLILGILANLLGRRDGASDHLVNCFAVGTTTFLMSLGTAISDASRQKVADTAFVDLIPWIVIFFILVMVSVNIDRYASWEFKGGKKTNKKRLMVGIILPNLVSIIAFVIYSISINGAAA